MESTTAPTTTTTTTTAPPVAESTVVQSEIVLRGITSLETPGVKDSLRTAIAGSLAVDLDQVNILGLARRLANDGVARRLADDGIAVQFEVILPGEPIDAEADSGSSSPSIDSMDNVVSRLSSMQTDATSFVGDLSQALEEKGVEVNEELSADVKEPTVKKRIVNYTAGPWGLCEIPPKTLCMSATDTFLRNRTVWCVDVEDLDTKLDDKLCESLPTRSRQENCPSELSPPTCGWQTSEWSPCTPLKENPCDSDIGEQKRSVICLSADGDKDCKDSGPAPSDSRSCNLERDALDALDCQNAKLTETPSEGLTDPPPSDDASMQAGAVQKDAESTQFSMVVVIVSGLACAVVVAVSILYWQRKRKRSQQLVHPLHAAHEDVCAVVPARISPDSDPREAQIDLEPRDDEDRPTGDLVMVDM